MTIDEIKEAISSKMVNHQGVLKSQPFSAVDPDKLAAFLHEQLFGYRDEKNEVLKECIHVGECSHCDPTPPSVKANGEEKEEWSYGDGYWFIDAGGRVTRSQLSDSRWHGNRRDFLGIYRTEKEAQNMADKIKSFVKQWR